MDKDTFNQLLQKTGIPGGGITPSGKPTIDPAVRALANVVRNLEQGLGHIAQNQYTLGMGIDTTRLTIAALVNMLVSKGIVTMEEWEAMYQKDVVEKINEYQKQMQEEAMKQAEAERQQIEELAQPTNQEPEQVVDSDVVLPSERGNVIRFPNT